MADEVDFAEALSRAERDSGVDRVRASVAGPGSAECDDCGRAIPPARRAVAPFAVRCVRCQRKSETPRVR